MLKKKIIFAILIISILGAILVFTIMTTGATPKQSDSMAIKHKLEQEQADLIKEKDAAAAKSQTNIAKENSDIIPAPEPEGLKTPHQWHNEQGSGHPIWKKANTVWTASGILEPNQALWDDFIVWSGKDDNGQQVIGTFAEPDMFNGKYTAPYACPNQDAGKIYIADIKGNSVYFKTENGSSGKFGLESHEWDFNK